MMYKCTECGCEFEEPRERKSLLCVLDGVPYFETLSVCPECGGDCEEACQCDICGEYHFEDDLEDGICESCIDKYKYDVDACYGIGEGGKITVELNSFLAEMFTTDEIEAILYRHLKSSEPTDCSPFIDADRYWFAQQIPRSKEVRE